jgi:preprotein translocase subunit Sss1
MKVMDKIYGFILNKLSDIFPIGGGAIGAITQVQKVSNFPTWEFILSAVIVATIGAVVGYVVKLLFDIIFKKLKNKYNVK